MKLSSVAILISGVLALGLGASTAGCRRGTDPEPSRAVTPSDGATLGGESAPATGEITVEAELAQGDQVAFTVANGTEAPAELLRALAVEQETAEGEWVELVAVGDLWLRRGCEPMGGVLFPDGESERCLELPPRTQLTPPPWLGTFGDAQCACERCAPVPAGRYRIIARGCHGERFESPPVSIRAREDADDLPLTELGQGQLRGNSPGAPSDS